MKETKMNVLMACAVFVFILGVVGIATLDDHLDKEHEFRMAECK